MGGGSYQKALKMKLSVERWVDIGKQRNLRLLDAHLNIFTKWKNCVKSLPESVCIVYNILIYVYLLYCVYNIFSLQYSSLCLRKHCNSFASSAVPAATNLNTIAVLHRNRISRYGKHLCT